MHPMLGALIAVAGPPPLSALVTDRAVNAYDVKSGGPTASATAGVRSLGSGVLQRRDNAVYTNLSPEWLLTGAAVDCEVRFEVVSGVAGTGVALNTWLPANVNREYTITATRIFAAGAGITTESGVVRVLYRNAATLVLLDQGDITVTAEAEQTV